MFEHLYKSKAPKPHPLTLFGEEKQLKPRKFSNSKLLSNSLLNSIKNKAIPCQESTFDKHCFIRPGIKNRLIIKSNPDIKDFIKRIIKSKVKEVPKSDPSFFFANIILPKKKLNHLYSKGFYIGSNKFSEEEKAKQSASRSLSFINNYGPR